MHKAAVLAKLLPDDAASHGHLSFVTEGEASLHFSLQSGLPMAGLNDGDRVTIVDAGGGTIDISSYSKDIGQVKNIFKEVVALQGEKNCLINLLFFKPGHFPQVTSMAWSS